MKTLFIFGFGFTARACAAQLPDDLWQIFATSRTDEGAKNTSNNNVKGLIFSDAFAPGPELMEALERATHVLVSIPPKADGDPVLNTLSDRLAAAGQLEWIGYLSTIGVYGDHNGAWIDEATPATPQSDRSKRRMAAETAWQDFATSRDVRLQIFRLAGIYGPGRSAIERVRDGRARAVIKPDQVFNRTHVYDAAAAIVAGMNGRGNHNIYNLTDDLPAPPQDPLNYAAELLGQEPPPQVPFADADLSEMARSFYGENKRVRNTRMREDLGVALRYPTYREGLTEIAQKS